MQQKAESRLAAEALHLAHYNFVRLHKNRRDPCYGGGDSDKLCTVDELVGADFSVRCLASYVAVCLMAATSVAAAPLTLKEAFRLAHTVASRGPVRPIVLESFDGVDSRFWHFEQYNTDYSVPSVHWQFLAVNKETGDVWLADIECIHVWPKLIPKQFANLKGLNAEPPQDCDGPTISN